MTQAEKRRAVIEQYKRIIGRNNYSVALRDYCFTPYDDGKYYSDCSSAICYSYQEAGLGFGIMTSADMYRCPALKPVDVVIQNGQVQNPEVLRVGDILLFAGNDEGRAYADYAGHAEMVFSVNDSGVTICGHSGGKPKLRKLQNYCKMRYHAAAQTKLGNQGLLKVVRVIE